jgi:hypothetical protein
LTLALCIWACGVYTTWLLIVALMGTPPDVFTIAAFLSSSAFLPAALVQATLTRLESKCWTGKGKLLAKVALALDVLTNAGGLWQWTQNIPSAPQMVALTEMISSVTGVTFGYGALVTVLLTLIVGLLIAYIPEALMRGDV